MHMKLQQFMYIIVPIGMINFQVIPISNRMISQYLNDTKLEMDSKRGIHSLTSKHAVLECISNISFNCYLFEKKFFYDIFQGLDRYISGIEGCISK